MYRAKSASNEDIVQAHENHKKGKKPRVFKNYPLRFEDLERIGKIMDHILSIEDSHLDKEEINEYSISEYKEHQKEIKAETRLSIWARIQSVYPISHKRCYDIWGEYLRIWYLRGGEYKQYYATTPKPIWYYYHNSLPLPEANKV